jgi:hypothetical protein
MSISRSAQSLTRAQAAAFDFDVVSDVPPPRSRPAPGLKAEETGPKDPPHADSGEAAG